MTQEMEVETFEPNERQIEFYESEERWLPFIPPFLERARTRLFMERCWNKMREWLMEATLGKEEEQS